MTRLFLAAGVAALAIAAPASAEKGGKGGGQGGQSAQVQGGGQRAQGMERAKRPQRMERAERPQQMQRMQQRAERPQQMERMQQRAQRAERRAERAASPQRMERQARMAERQQVRTNRVDKAQARMAERQQVRTNRVDKAQARMAERQKVRVNRIDKARVRQAERQQARVERIDRVDSRIAQRQDKRFDRDQFRNDRVVLSSNRGGVGFGVGGCPPGLDDKNNGCIPPGQAMKADRAFAGNAFRTSRLAALTAFPQTQFIEPLVVSQYVGQPVSTLSQLAGLSILPQSVQYLYPDNDDHYYRYGGGYVYRVERDNDLIDWILPMLAGGFMPGQYLPNTYMSSYVPDYYGLNSFYPTNYASYGAGYGSSYDNLCNRYANGVVYQVDCGTGFIEDVVPLYAGGYGVGQMLPASYSYYNVPSQYRDLYSNTDDYNYWYAPGAIYQYDPGSSLITSVAALLAPGFSVGQQLPSGYGMYNVPTAYRDTYYDTPNAWYRYNNGNIYQVDPTTQLITALVASILT